MEGALGDLDGTYLLRDALTGLRSAAPVFLFDNMYLNQAPACAFVILADATMSSGTWHVCDTSVLS